MNSSENIIIEKARPQDTDELLRFLKAVGGETDNLTFGAEGLPVSPDEERKLLASLETSETSAMFTAKKSGKIVGNAHFTGMTRERLKHRGTIGISVLKSEWGQGIGTMLMEAVIDFARNTAHAEIIVCVVFNVFIRCLHKSRLILPLMIRPTTTKDRAWIALPSAIFVEIE